MTAPVVDMVRTMVGGQWRCEWRAQCDQCGAVETRHWGDLSDPRLAEKKFKARGWTFGKVAVCSACTAKPKHPPRQRATAQTKVSPMTDRKPNPPQPRNLTIEERARVRETLEVYFDAEKGFYTDGYSDKRVGQELDLPWASVAKFRDFAFGPIRSHPLLEEIRTGIAAVEKTLATLKTKAADLEQRLTRAA